MERAYQPVVRVILCETRAGDVVPVGVLTDPTAEQEQRAMDWLAGELDDSFFDTDAMTVVHVPLIRPDPEG